MKYPADIYQPSTRPYRGIGELSYPFHDRTVLVTYCGRICIFKKKINLSTSLAGQAVGIKEVDDGIWLVSFMDYDLGYIDLEEKTLQPLKQPLWPQGVSYVFGTFCKGCLRTVQKGSGGEGGILPEHPKKFSVVMVKLKSFIVNEQFLQKSICQCSVITTL